MALGKKKPVGKYHKDALLGAISAYEKLAQAERQQAGGTGRRRITESDRRFAEAAAAISTQTGKPILTATELGTTDPANPGPAAVRESGRLCYGSADRAVRALGHLYRYARFRERRGLS